MVLLYIVWKKVTTNTYGEQLDITLGKNALRANPTGLVRCLLTGDWLICTKIALIRKIKGSLLDSEKTDSEYNV